jgi:hypothetical protein
MVGAALVMMREDTKIFVRDEMTREMRRDGRTSPDLDRF